MESKTCSSEGNTSSVSLCDVSSIKSPCADQPEEAIHHQKVMGSPVNMLAYMFSSAQIILIKCIIDLK